LKWQTQQTVLIVKDELLIRMCSVATLGDAGYRVLEAGNSAEALAILVQPNVIVILMTDVRMPGEMDGLGLAAKVRTDRPECLHCRAGREAFHCGNFGSRRPQYYQPRHGCLRHRQRLRSEPYRAPGVTESASNTIGVQQAGQRRG
jgi:CheY-like chemotaxis protein